MVDGGDEMGEESRFYGGWRGWDGGRKVVLGQVDDGKKVVWLN